DADLHGRVMVGVPACDRTGYDHRSDLPVLRVDGSNLARHRQPPETCFVHAPSRVERHPVERACGAVALSPPAASEGLSPDTGLCYSLAIRGAVGSCCVSAWSASTSVFLKRYRPCLPA